MIATIEWLLARKWGKPLLELALLAGAVFGAWTYAEHLGREAQKQDDQQAQTRDIEKSRAEAQAARDQVVKQANDRADAADKRAQEAEDRVNAAVSKLSDLASRQQAASDHVKGVADADLHRDVISQLKLRSPGDTAACYTAKEERAIDDAVTQWPLCRQQAQTLAGQDAAEKDKTTAATDKVADKQKTIDADEAYIAQLQGDYKTLFDQHPPRYRSWACLKLWKCGKQQVNFNPAVKP